MLVSCKRKIKTIDRSTTISNNQPVNVGKSSSKVIPASGSTATGSTYSNNAGKSMRCSHWLCWREDYADDDDDDGDEAEDHDSKRCFPLNAK